MWRLGDELAVRLPRRPRAPGLLRTERRWLPILAADLPLPVPVPVRAGEPSDRFPETWTIARWVDGSPADIAPISDPRSADTLAGFLLALHRLAPGAAPVSRNRGVPLATLESDFEAWLPIAGDAAADARRVFEQAAEAPVWDGAPLWLHGDLHPANVVVAAGRLTGVLDFGDMCVGDPATDLSAAWVLLPDGTAPRFFDAYANATDATIQRARGWAVLRAIGLIGIGQNGDRGLPGGKPTWGPAGRSALERALTLA
jgi:aminoglycoside phosphotransferase (APT) family kinase protein